MYSNNSVWVNGNVVKDVYYGEAKEGKQSFCSFRVAVNTDKDSAFFMPVKCFGFTADNCSALKKGSRVLITGRMYEDSWEKEDGTEVKSIGIIAENVGSIVVVKKEEF